MTDTPQPADVVDDGASDVMSEDEVVHVAPGGAELAESNDIVTGPGGQQILLEDPSGNPIDLFQPAGTS